MTLGILVLLTALGISAVAIYYSVAGLVAIFAAATAPIIIMGAVLETGKLVAAVWLHKYWNRATWWLKMYLSSAVLVLMVVTSMGIFGFLSKAHIEQTTAAGEGVAQLERINQEIARQQAVIERAEVKVQDVQDSSTGVDANIQQQIDREQRRIDTAYTRAQPAIDEQNAIVSAKTKLFQDQVDTIDKNLVLLQQYINSNEIRKAQGMVGTRADGAYGPATAAAFTAYQEARQVERNKLIQQIVSLGQDPTVQAARDEIRRLRQTVENQIEQSNQLINRLRNQLGQDTGTDINAVIEDQTNGIKAANAAIETLVEQKFTLEADYRKLEAEVGPIKYIAEFVYGEKADKDLLEEAVRWVIIILIIVFDPLALALLIAAQYTFKWYREDKAEGDSLNTESGSNIVVEPTVTTPPQTFMSAVSPELHHVQTDRTTPESVADTRQSTRHEPSFAIQSQSASNDDPLGDQSRNEDIHGSVGPDDEVEQFQEHTEPLITLVEKKDTESLVESKRLTEAELEELDQDDDWKEAKHIWKEAHPDETLKHQKDLYLSGIINELPWAADVKKKKYIVKENTVQIQKTTQD